MIPHTIMVISHLGFPRKNRTNDECIPQLSDETVSKFHIDCCEHVVVSSFKFFYCNFCGKKVKTGKNTNLRCSEKQ